MTTNNKKEFISMEKIEQFLKEVDGESIPIAFIDHIIVFYVNGEIKQIKGSDIKKMFPKLSHTTMGILKNNGDILEINVKIDIDKIYNYLNTLSEYVDKEFNYWVNFLRKDENKDG